ncbi:branched-chain amino acid transport system II carrier protein, partial [Enterococcus faecalis]|uniref:branched-chain amino acid transport system II carrier protein n=1 Tax=Enterococcus faecalis TaxID=1351 RepID=UPI003D6C61B0
LGFGIVVVSTLPNIAVEKPGDIAKGMIKPGVFSVVLMGIIYTLLAYMGTMSRAAYPIRENGGVDLDQIANYYLDLAGGI